MREDGFSMVEILVVVAIVATLVSIATLQYGEMSKKSAIEGQVKSMHADLTSVRLQALYGKKDRTVTISGRSFKVYSSSITTVPPVQTTTLKFPVVWNSGGGPGVTFNAKGLTDSSTDLSLCIDPINDLSVSNPGFTDSLVISTARVFIGKRRVPGGGCAPDQIDRK
jgi:prepilin-type N-terminal cleavage/methylation domain-containing protein